MSVRLCQNSGRTMRETSNLVRIDPRTDPLWGRLLERQRESLFHSGLWLDVLHQTYQMDIQANLLLDGSWDSLLHDLGHPRRAHNLAPVFRLLRPTRLNRRTVGHAD